jgi:aquaporin Z
MKKYFVEFIGTFFLVFTIGNVVVAPGAGLFGPLAIGFVLTAMIYAGGHISGAHYNPAVTMAFWLREKMNSRDVFPYMITQTVAGVLAALAVLLIKGASETSPMEISILPALVAETLFTFALCLVILEVATSKATQGNSYYGIAIGFTVMAGTYAVGSISGGVFNPAVAVGIIIMGIVDPSSIWIYLCANSIGGFFAVAIYKLIHSDESLRGAEH